MNDTGRKGKVKMTPLVARVQLIPVFGGPGMKLITFRKKFLDLELPKEVKE